MAIKKTVIVFLCTAFLVGCEGLMPSNRLGTYFFKFNPATGEIEVNTRTIKGGDDITIDFVNGKISKIAVKRAGAGLENAVNLLRQAAELAPLMGGTGP